MSILLPLLAPIAALHSLVWAPLTHHGVLPLTYLAGIYALALVYSFYFLLFQDRYNVLWLYGILFVFFYLGFMLWQTYYAIVDLPHRRLGHAARDSRHRRRRRRGRTVSLHLPFRRAFAALLLPVSLVPVLLLAPSLVRAPATLWRHTAHALAPAHATPRPPAAQPARATTWSARRAWRSRSSKAPPACSRRRSASRRSPNRNGSRRRRPPRARTAPADRPPAPRSRN